jgi:hypothetical protein
MRKDVLVLPLDCFSRLDRHLRRIEMHLLDDDNVLCTLVGLNRLTSRGCCGKQDNHRDRGGEPLKLQPWRRYESYLQTASGPTNGIVRHIPPAVNGSL